MKTFFRIAAAAALFAAMTACDAFHSLTKSRLKTAQGSPYELIVVCPQQELSLIHISEPTRPY